MEIVATVIYILVLLMPLLILLVPFIVAWWRGAKNLQKAHKLYSRALRISLSRLFKVNIEYTTLGPLEAVFQGKDGLEVAGKVFLADRRAYAYYLVKIFKEINDGIVLELIMQKPPGCSMLIVSKERPKLLEKALGFAKKLETIDLAGLENFLVMTDNIYAAQRIFDAITIQELVNLRKAIAYIILDYEAPQIEFFFEISEKKYAELIPRILTLTKHIAEIALKIPPRKSKLEAMRMLKKALRIE